MKNLKTLIAALVFFIVSVLFIAFQQPLLTFFPAQQVELSHGVQYGAVLKNFLFVQEITLQKRFISRIDLYMAKLPSQYANQNAFLLLDEQHRILYTKRFSSNDFGEALYFSFDFKKNFDIGKGKKVYACIYSIDGDQGSYIGLAKKENSTLGKLYVVAIVNNDIVQSFEKQQSLVNFSGSIGARTFESDTRFFSFFQDIFYLLALGIAMLVFFGRQIVLFIRKSMIKPEFAFLGFSLVFGMIMLVVNPPFMVPDEPVHLFRSYQISEFNIFKFKGDIPQSLVQLSSVCDRMKYSTHEKTTRKEILSLAAIRLDSDIRTVKETTDYTIPYIPQAIGIFIGKIFHLNPLWLLYLGRMFNLLVSIILVFIAIRSTPLLKWSFFLLGVMPMTLYQFSSLSYDAMTIGLSFLLIATILNYAFNNEKRIGSREILILFLLSGLIAASKPPYFILVFTFLIIPVVKIGTRRKYIIVFAGLISTVIIVSQLWAPGRKFLERFIASKDPVLNTRLVCSVEESIPPKIFSYHNPLTAMLPLLPHTNSTAQSAADQTDSTKSESQPNQQPQGQQTDKDSSIVAASQFDPPAQKKFILEDPIRYIGILFDTLLKSIGLYTVSFIGLFGWVDTPMPNYLAYAYLFIILLVSIGIPAKGIRIGILKKCILSAIFIVCYVGIETAMYLYCNPVGSNPIIAVQGRYFIAIGPLIFLLLSNNTFFVFFQKRLLPASKKPARTKKKQKQPSVTVNSDDMLFSKILPWIAVIIALTTLTCCVFVILERFYVVSM